MKIKPLMIFAIVISMVSVSISYAYKQLNQGDKKTALVAALKEKPDIPINADNSEQAPLMVVSAQSKEIDQETYTLLTGKQGATSNYIALPDVNLVNNSQKTIASFCIVVRNNLTGDLWMFRKKNQKIAPGDGVTVSAKTWAAARSRMSNTFKESGDKFTRSNGAVDLDSEAMWVLGGVAENRVSVGEITFEDGTSWITKQ
jgi:hypothetical protein